MVGKVAASLVNGNIDDTENVVGVKPFYLHSPGYFNGFHVHSVCSFTVAHYGDNSMNVSKYVNITF